jgi:branched-chain amino acid aminotransferase
MLPPREPLLDALQRLLRRNRLLDAYLRLTLSRGPGLGPDPPQPPHPTVVMLARPLSLPPREKYRRGLSLISVTQPPSPLARLKSLNYLDKLLARRRARHSGADDALLVSPKGLLLEASASNLFLVESGRLFTPRLQAGVLPGITRAVVMKLARKLGLPCRALDLTRVRLRQADECFLTNSIIEIIPVCRIDRRPLRSGRPGPITAAVMAAYRELVAAELGLKSPG